MTTIQQWLYNNFDGYSDLEEAEVEAIRDFTLVWTIFEQRLQGNNSTPSSLRDISKRNWQPVRENLNTLLAYFQRRYVNGTSMDDRFKQLRFRKNDCEEEVRQALLGQDTDDSEIVFALLMIVRRLRNNLFHGYKAAYGFQDQKSNFEYASKLLMLIVDSE